MWFLVYLTVQGRKEWGKEGRKDGWSRHLILFYCLVDTYLLFWWLLDSANKDRIIQRALDHTIPYHAIPCFVTYAILIIIALFCCKHSSVATSRVLLITHWSIWKHSSALIRDIVCCQCVINNWSFASTLTFLLDYFGGPWTLHYSRLSHPAESDGWQDWYWQHSSNYTINAVRVAERVLEVKTEWL